MIIASKYVGDLFARIDTLAKENERLRGKLTVNVDFWKAHAEGKDKANQEARSRIDAALALLESIPPHDRELALVKAIEALKGEK